MVKTPEAIRFYSLAVNVEKNLKKKRYSVQQRIEIKESLNELYKKTADEINIILGKENKK